MVRVLSVILLIIAFGIQTFQRAALVVDYYSNTTAFAKNCINKWRPKLNCNGQCQLMKKLKASEEKEKQQTEQNGGFRFEVLANRSDFGLTPPPVSITLKTKYPGSYASAPPIDRPGYIFHPPNIIQTQI